MENKEFQNLDSETSEFQRRVITFVLALYEKEKKPLPPSIFIKTGGNFKLHPIPPHLFGEKGGEKIIEDGISTILQDHNATHACFGAECAYVSVNASDEAAVKKALSEGVESMDNVEKSVVLSFESRDKYEKYLFRFKIEDNETVLAIQEVKEYTEEEGDADLMLKLFKK